MMNLSPSLGLLWTLTAGLLAGCAQEKFLFFQPTRNPNIVTFAQNVKEIHGADAVDVLWVIDNSGSMSEHQRNVISNTNVFMQNFSKSALKWKMGLISTDQANRPYIGFEPNNELNYLTLDPVGAFQSAVSRLGTAGSATEKTLTPILGAMRSYPTFARPGVPFAIMVVSDADEQSSLNFNRDFLPEFQTRVGDKDKVFVYQVLNASDLGCNGENGGSGPWNYRGSGYESLALSATIGKVFPLCANDFGKTLADIGNEIVQQVSFPKIYLNQRPKASTLSVTYKGEVLKGGEKIDGGFWIYDFDMNAIVFHDLYFAIDNTDSVTVNYDVDDGF